MWKGEEHLGTELYEYAEMEGDINRKVYGINPHILI